MIVKKVPKLDIFVIDKLVDASYHGNDSLALLLRNTILDPIHWQVVGGYKDDDKLVCAFLVKIEGKTAIIWLLGADDFFSWYKDAQAPFDQYFKEEGCNKIKFYGRVGWMRRPPQGWKITSVEFVREI